MDTELRTKLVLGRFDHYFSVMRTTLFAFTAIAAVISFAPNGFNFALAIVIVGVTAYGVLAGNTILEDLESLREDMIPDVSETHYGKTIAKRNIAMLRMISAGVISVIGVVEFIAAIALDQMG